jgi:flagella basal body P-ring formation protein FlgA
MSKSILKASIFSTLIFAGNSIACEIVSYSQIYRVENQLDKKIIRKSNCDESIQQKFIQSVTNASGNLPVNMIERTLMGDSIEDVEISPSSITILDMKDYLAEKLMFKNNRRITHIKSLTNISSIQPKANITPIVHCSNCDATGEKNIKVSFNDKYFWFNITVKQPYKVWVPKKNISAFNKSLKRSDFISKIIYDLGNKSYFEDIKNIRFYRTTQAIKADTPLLSTRLVPLKLVRVGQKVTLFLKGKSVNLKSKVMAKSSGIINDIVELKNPRSNKKFIAKVIDFNTAEIEL